MEGPHLSDAEPIRSIMNEKQRKVPLQPRSYMFIVIVLVILLGFWFIVIKNKQKNSEKRPLPIVSAVAKSRDVPVYLSALGSVIPTYSVTVKTQINGLLQEVLFKEGQMVSKGEVLAQIDPRPYEALLKQYEGNLQRDKALLANALIDLKRYQTLWKQDSVSQQTLATQQSLVKQYEGAVKTDMGLIESTKVSLTYCRITSPIDGRIGLRLVDPGNFVQVSDANGIAVINMLNPITVIFSLAEDNVPKVMPKIYKKTPLLVEAFDRQVNQKLADGKLLTIDNQIDPTTGTFKLKASFDNKENSLFPNQFVNVKLLIQTLTNATIVPTAAVQHAKTYDFVYVVNKDNTVTIKRVITGPVDGDEIVIQSGIAPGEAVVVAGVDKLTNGVKVAVSEPNKKMAAILHHFNTTSNLPREPNKQYASVDSEVRPQKVHKPDQPKGSFIPSLHGYS